MAIFLPLPVDPAWDPYEFAAQMTGRQFLALEQRLDHGGLLEEVTASKRFRSAQLAKAADLPTLRRWLVNGWSTEVVLDLSGGLVKDAGGATLQWIFPQAYYAVFASSLAYFQAAGFTETSHAGVQRRFAQVAKGRSHPPSLRFAMEGTSDALKPTGLKPAVEPAPIHFRPHDSGSIDRKIYQFLKTTREYDLKSKAHDMDFRTRAGKPRKRLEAEHWRDADKKLGPTGLLHLLYRKRIKANYREMDAFLESGFQPDTLFTSLKRLVRCVSFVHECLIARSTGKKWYRATVDDYLRSTNAPFLEKRATTVLDLCG